MSKRFLRWAVVVVLGWLGSSVASFTQAQGTNEEAKWSQLPGFLVFTNSPQMRGGDRPSDFDWVTVSTNAATNLVVLDQSYVWGPPDDREFVIQNGFERAQTFTVGASGILSRVEFFIRREGQTNAGDLMFDVRATTGGGAPVEDGPLLASVLLPAASIPPSYGFVSVDLTALPCAQLTVSTGQVLAMALRVVPNNPNATYRWPGSGSNSYPRGVLYTRGNSAATWTAFGNGALDASIRTYVDVGITNLAQPNWVIADDFISDGRPITAVRWWGSFLPGYTNGFEEGFVLSFFGPPPPDVVVCASSPAVSGHPEFLAATYVAPRAAVRSVATGYTGWDSNAIYQYEVDLKDTCLVHANTNVATPTAFLEVSNTVYWLAIDAEVGHRIIAQTNQSGVVTNWVEQVSGKRATNHFWGWQTSPVTNYTGNLSRSTMGHLLMPGTNWVYPPRAWKTNDFFHMELDQAFELLTPCLALFCPTNFTVWTCSTSAPVFFTVSATGACDTNVTITCTPASGSPFPVGTNTVTCVASDSQGHSNSCSFAVTVIRDTTAPVIACPTNQTVLTTGLGAIVSYTATATDDWDTNVLVQCAPPSGSIFPVGDTTVNCDAIDDCGNAAQCSFTVRVDRASGDVVIVTVTNTTGQTASDLHVTFSGAGGNLTVDPTSVVAPGCPVPTVPSNGMVTDTAVIDWGSACVAPGAVVRLTVQTTNGPLAVANAFWTGAGGQNIGPAVAALRHATVLIFEPSNELQPVPDTYGDRVISSPDANGDLYGAGSGFTPGVVVNYGPAGSSVLEAPSDYGDLSRVAYQEDGDFGVLEVTLTADPGVQVILDSFDLAGLGCDYLIDAVQVLDENEVELFGQTEVIIAGDNSQHTHFDFGPASLTSPVLKIRVDVHRLGNTESHQVGIDNIQFSQFPETLAPCPPAPALTIERSGASVLISWMGGGYCLQGAPVLANPPSATLWTTLGGGPPVTVPASSGNQFFRLICPCP